MKHAVSSSVVLNALALCANSNTVITLHDNLVETFRAQTVTICIQDS